MPQIYQIRKRFLLPDHRFEYLLLSRGAGLFACVKISSFCNILLFSYCVILHYSRFFSKQTWFSIKVLSHDRY
jgi:hypothetical protein